MNIIGKKYWYFIISTIVIIPGIISLFLFGLNMSIEFTGGSRLTLTFEKNVTDQQIKGIKDVFNEKKIKISTVERSQKDVFIRTSPITEEEDTFLIEDLKIRVGEFKQSQYETVGPTIGGETTLNALKALGISSLLIVLYITWSFRKVPKPTSSFRFGIAAIIALIHDVLLLL